MGKPTPNYDLEPHTIRMPYSSLVFGRNFEIPLECVFGYSGDLKSTHAIEIKSITSKGDNGLNYDMMYLVEEDEGELTKHIITCILNNHKNWDTGEDWWSN